MPSVETLLPSSSMRILMLEDDDGIRECLKDYFDIECVKNHCDSAADVPTATQLLRTRTYRVVFCDLMIHGVACLDFLSLVRSLQPHAKLVIMSAWKGAEETAKEIGADHFLPKPFSIELIEEYLYS